MTTESRRVVEYLAAECGFDVALSEARFGGAAIDATGSPLEDSTVARALASDAVLMGAVGGPKWLDRRTIRVLKGGS